MKQGDVSEVLAVRMGTRTTTRRDVYLNYHLYGTEDGPATVDYFFWLIRHPSGPIVVDTGFGQEAGLSRGRTPIRPVDEALGYLNVEADNVRHVIVTHAHYDHIGNLSLFPNAEIHVASTELDFWTSSIARNVQFWHYAEQQEIDYFSTARREQRLREFTGTAEPVDGVVVEEVGGHTPGQSIVRVNSGGQRIVLASDAIHFYEEWEADMPFTAIADLPQMYKIFADFRAEDGETFDILVPGHDADVLKRFPPVPGYPDGDAVIIATEATQ